MRNFLVNEIWTRYYERELEADSPEQLLATYDDIDIGDADEGDEGHFLGFCITDIDTGIDYYYTAYREPALSFADLLKKMAFVWGNL